MNLIKVERVIALKQKSRQMVAHYGEPDWDLEWELSELEDSLTNQEVSKILEIETSMLF
jgi:hypothetical protein